RSAPPPEPAAPADLAAEVALARAASDAAERDDLLFARAQATVRRALLATAARLGVSTADIFWLPFDELRGAADAAAWRRAMAAPASAARSAAARAARWDMPLVVDPAGDGAASAPAAGDTWRGDGLGGRA